MLNSVSNLSSRAAPYSLHGRRSRWEFIRLSRTDNAYCCGGSVSAMPAHVQSHLPPKTLPRDTKVVALLHADGGWNKELVGSECKCIDVDCIMQLEVGDDQGLCHVLIHCSFARLVWALSHLPWSIVPRDDLEPEEWVRHATCTWMPDNLLAS
ncbi:hypothetical protein Salat_0192800 [Sesamum alatum]|uniref:Uncharacterized protein n=1 Tax=Sesamum alatum TaxID=300844 RepID=A0AAE1YZF0_9LAMI|nr:hypothetical protein Salat_0192800 [Sesamum alatum]